MAFEEEIQDDVMSSKVPMESINESDIISLKSNASKKRNNTGDKQKSRKIKEKIRNKGSKNKLNFYHILLRETYLVIFDLLSKLLLNPSNY